MESLLYWSSTNKYKHLKVGFRVCYELSKDELWNDKKMQFFLTVKIFQNIFHSIFDELANYGEVIINNLLKIGVLQIINLGIKNYMKICNWTNSSFKI